MYKLFLCLRYLTRRPIALLPMIGIALCVWMVLVVSSVMTGFLDLIEDAARGMLGDVIVDVGSSGGLPHYDELITEIERVPGVSAATPVVYSYGLLRLDEDFTQFARLVGLRLPEATRVTTFAEGLWPDGLEADPAFAVPPAQAEGMHGRAEWARGHIAQIEQDIDRLEDRLFAELEKAPDQQNADLIARLQADMDMLRRQANQYDRRFAYDPHLPGTILGVDIPGTTDRDPVTGEVRRYLDLGQKVVLMMLPIGRGRVSQNLEPISRQFTIAGDSRVGLYQVDSQHVYMDFDVLQDIVDMGPKTDLDTGRVDPARANQVLIKATPPTNEAQLRRIASEVQAAVDRLTDRHPEDLASVMIEVRTWREKQAMFIGPFEKQRTLVVIMFLVVSLVAVVLVFAIFYMLVVQKIKDIGILKSIGGSSWGVGVVFLLYGAAIGLVGSVLGATGGYFFVRNINPIHDWVAEVFNYPMFDRRVYFFDQIPNTVNTQDLVMVVVAALLAGLVGALLPAMRAARMQPVEALRHE